MANSLNEDIDRLSARVAELEEKNKNLLSNYETLSNSTERMAVVYDKFKKERDDTWAQYKNGDKIWPIGTVENGGKTFYCPKVEHEFVEVKVKVHTWKGGKIYTHDSSRVFPSEETAVNFCNDKNKFEVKNG